MKPIFTHRAAVREIEETVAWYEAREIGVGLDFLEQYEAELAVIQADPANSSPHTMPPFRYRTLKRFPFSVYFVELPDLVWIAAVPHHSREPGYWEHRSLGDP